MSAAIDWEPPPVNQSGVVVQVMQGHPDWFNLIGVSYSSHNLANWNPF